MISNRFARPIYPYIDKSYDESKTTKYASYPDANNLYEGVMCQPLHVRNFKWMQLWCPAEGLIDFENWRETPCILEVELEYSKELHDDLNDYPLVLERLRINGVKKLIPNLNDKKRWVVNHKTLKQCLDLGLKIKKIHRGISLKEEPWLRIYIDLNSSLRANAKNEIEKESF